MKKAAFIKWFKYWVLPWRAGYRGKNWACTSCQETLDQVGQAIAEKRSFAIHFRPLKNHSGHVETYHISYKPFKRI